MNIVAPWALKGLAADTCLAQAANNMAVAVGVLELLLSNSKPGAEFRAASNRLWQTWQTGNTDRQG